MDKNETSLIAAAIETIEKIGPSETKIKIEKIDDVRGSKRDFIMERAKQLLGGLSASGSSDMNLKDIGRELGENSRVSIKMKTYGTENLPCGDISGDEVVVVEGRADVVNMIRQGVNNVICMNGMKLPETIKELSKEKTITLFVDGDRGGKLIAKNVIENATIKYVAVAPEGKEVEELTGKEILQALRRRVTTKEYIEMESRGRRFSREEPREYRNERTESREEVSEAPAKKERKIEKMTEKEKEIVKNALDELIGTKAAILYNRKMEVIRKIPLGRLGFFKPEEEVYVLAINDTAIPGIIRVAEEMGAHNLAAKNFTTTNTAINLVSI